MEKEMLLSSFAEDKPSCNEVFTIGYEGSNINNFINILKENKIQTLIDVREIPLSRKKGFSKTSFKENIGKEGINYLHIKELGSPKELRKKLYEDGDYNFFFKRFNEYIETKESLLKSVHQKILSERCCLMCFEKNHEFCHRSIISNEIKKIDNNGLKIKHL